MRFPHLSSIHRHATVIVGSCIGIRVKILANARDTSRLVHRFFIDDTSLHDNDEERHYHNVVLRLVVSVISIIFRRKKKKKKIHFIVIRFRVEKFYSMSNLIYTIPFYRIMPYVCGVALSVLLYRVGKHVKIPKVYKKKKKKERKNQYKN